MRNRSSNSSVRVLFWSDTFWPQIGGVEVLAAKLLPALQARGYEYTVVASKNHPDMPDQESFRGFPVHRFLFSNNLSRDEIEHVAETRQKLIALKRSFAPALIHLNHAGVSHFFHLITADVHAAPTLFTLHGEWPDRANSIVARTLRSADWVVGCSAAIINKARTLAPEILLRSSVIYNAIDAPQLAAAPLPFEAPRLLCLGRLAVEKGFDLALHAFHSIARRFPNARLIIAGDGPARSELERLTVDLELAGRVEFLGWVGPEDVPALINTSTMLLMPSRLESLPLAALQAAVMARPIVATDVGGLPEVVLHRETGLLSKDEDYLGFAEGVSFLLDHPNAAARMGQAARARVQTLFNWDRHVDAYEALYRQLVERQTAAVR